MKPTRLQNPPIKEALIDLRVSLPPTTTVENLAAFHKAISSTYPQSQEHVALSHTFGFGADGKAQVNATERQHLGFICRSADQLQVAQARLDGFTLNRLFPYTHWEKFSGEARALWSEYVEVAHPVEVQRIAVRYINRIELLAGADLKDYFRTLPVLSPDLPQKVSNVFMRIQVPKAKGRGAVITMAVENDGPPKTPGAVAIIFDVDASDESHFSPDDAAIWKTLEELRDLKNEIFFSSLTESVLKGYA
jgi:uncharacterized protein (TIGR04255 family)